MLLSMVLIIVALSVLMARMLMGTFFLMLLSMDIESLAEFVGFYFFRLDVGSCFVGVEISYYFWFFGILR